jgi:hypothetical protein
MCEKIIARSYYVLQHDKLISLLDLENMLKDKRGPFIESTPVHRPGLSPKKRFISPGDEPCQMQHKR